MIKFSAPIIYMGLIYFLSSIHGNNTNPETLLDRSLLWFTPGFQNLLHIPLFFGLALTWIYALKNTIKAVTPRLTAALLLTVIYGVSDEIHQYFTPGRYASFSDIFLDALGASLIFLIPLASRLAPFVTQNKRP